MKTERKYALIRVAAGDYLLPSNDLKTLWRIRSYREYGDAYWVDVDGKEHVVKGIFWEASRYFDGPMAAVDDDDLLDRDRWQSYSDSHRTRQEAIDEALRREEKP